MVMYSEAECNFLASTAHHWVPQLSNQLMVTHKTFPVLMHGMPTSFYPLDLRDSNDVCHLVAQNNHLITHPLILQHTKFLPRPCAASQCKTCSSLILYLTNAKAINDCIAHHVVYLGRLLPTVKFTCQPLQCYNCYLFSHFARSFRATVACGPLAIVLACMPHATASAQMLQSAQCPPLADISSQSVWHVEAPILHHIWTALHRWLHMTIRGPDWWTLALSTCFQTGTTHQFEGSAPCRK